jgi:predicted phage tail protein
MKVKFCGALKQFGECFDVKASSPKDAVRLVSIQINGCAEYIRKNHFKVRLGATDLNAETVSHSSINDAVVYVEPAVYGSKNSGTFNIIAGAILIATAVVLTVATGGSFAVVSAGAMTAFGTAVVMGATMILSGTMMLLTPQPDEMVLDRPEEKQSFLFNGAVNSYAQGNPIPLVYGRFGVGSVVVSAGITSENI